MCTGSSAAVRSVTAAAAASGSRFSVRASMSAKTGRARSKSTALALATNENGEGTTSSPSDTPTARRPRCTPAVPLAPPPAGASGPRARVLGSQPGREGLLEGRHPRPQRELARAQDLDDRGLLLGP